MLDNGLSVSLDLFIYFSADSNSSYEKASMRATVYREPIDGRMTDYLSGPGHTIPFVPKNPETPVVEQRALPAWELNGENFGSVAIYCENAPDAL